MLDGLLKKLQALQQTHHIILNLNAATKLLFRKFVLICHSKLISARNLLLNNVQSMQDLFTKVDINTILRFL